MNEDTQIILVYNYMKEHGSITSQEAWRAFNITRLSSIIHRMRGLGYQIETIMVRGIGSYNRPCRYAKYVLKEDKDESVSD